MAELRARFLTRASEDAARIEEALGAGDLVTVRSLAHGLSGTAGIFGFSEVGASAQVVEEAIDAGTDKGEIRVMAVGLLDQLSALDQER